MRRSKSPPSPAEEQKSRRVRFSTNVRGQGCQAKCMQGICLYFLEVMPTGPAEVFRVKLDVPEFTPLEAGTDWRGASGN